MTAYYNEYDPKAAAWLRELIRCGLIAPGDVDERSIEDVSPADLAGYTQCHFFAGIGVWSHALRCAGWPDDRLVWTGSCPCQPFSAAGKGGGFADERHLWPAFHYLIEQCRPPVVLGEQVASKDGLAWLDLVQADLEGSGYASGALDTCAAGFGAPHIRQRLYWIGERLADADDARPQGWPLPAERAGERLAGPGGVAGGLEHASGDGRVERRPEPGGRGAASRRGEGGLALTDDAERRPDLPARNDRRGADTGRSQGAGDIGTGSAIGGLGDTDGQHEAPLGGVHEGAFAAAARSGDRPGPTNGLWRDADWLFCRDGKWRPVEASPQPLVDGVAESLGRVRDGCLEEFQEEMNAISVEGQIDRASLLRDVREALGAQTQREWEAGRLPGLHEAPFLLALLCQFEAQGWKVEEGIALSCSEDARARVRMLWNAEAAARPSHQRGLDGQQPDQRADAVHLLSSILARHASTSWADAYEAYAEVGFPLGKNAPARVGRLRGYGNAIVAPAAQAFIEAYLEVEADRHLRLTSEKPTDTLDIFG